MKKVLFISGLYNYSNFEEYIKSIFKQKHIYFKYRNCRELSQSVIDENDIIIAYSFGVQYLVKYNIEGKRIILICPLLNSVYITDERLRKINKMLNKSNAIINAISKIAIKILGGKNEYREQLLEDAKNYVRVYGNEDINIKDIEPSKDWIIIEGRRAITQTKQIMGKYEKNIYSIIGSKIVKMNEVATDDNGNTITHILNYDNHLMFVDKYIC